MINEEYFKTDREFQFELATVSVIAKEIKTYLIDVPYRYYYAQMNRYITEENGFDRIFKKDNKKGEEYKRRLNYLYFKYEINSGSKKLYLNSIFKFEQNTDCSPIEIFRDNNWTVPNEKELIIEWLSILDASIFYNDDGIEKENNGTAEERKWSDEFPERIVEDNNVNKSNTSNYIIEILWFYHDIRMEEYSLHSSINYSFYQVTPISCDYSRSIEEVHKAAKKFYEVRRPIIVSRAKEFLFPYYHSEMMKYALQSAVSQITARNYAHHIGSHVKNRATLSKIRERIEDIYPEKPQRS